MRPHSRPSDRRPPTARTPGCIPRNELAYLFPHVRHGSTELAEVSRTYDGVPNREISRLGALTPLAKSPAIPAVSWPAADGRAAAPETHPGRSSKMPRPALDQIASRSICES